MDAAKWTALFEVLEEQMRIIADLTALSKKKSQVVVDGSLDALDLLLRGEQALIWQMGQLEERRLKLQMESAQEAGLHLSELTLDRLRTLVAPEERERLAKVAAGLHQSVDELAHFNELNGALVSQAMAFVDFSLQALGASNANARQIYSSRGSRGQVDPQTHRLDNRI